MGQHPKLTLALSCLMRPAPEGTAEPPLVPAESGFGLPAVAVDPPVSAPLRLLAEPLDHLPPVHGRGPLPAPAAAVQGDDGGPHPEILPGVAVVALGIEGGVGQHPVPSDGQGRLGHRRSELRGVVGRAGGDPRPGEEVAPGIHGDGELGPQPGRVFPPGPLEEVAGGVTALQAGPVDRGGRLRPDQAAIGCGRGGAQQEDDGLPFFSSRAAA